MIKKIKIGRLALWIVLAALFLPACTPAGHSVTSQYTPPSTVDGQLCAQECTRAKNHCIDLCSAAHPGCRCEQEYQVCYEMCGTRTTTYH